MKQFMTISPDERRTPHSPTPIQTVSSIIVALVAVLNFIAQYKDKPTLAWTLIAVAVLAIAFNFYSPAIQCLVKKSQQRRNDSLARQAWPEVQLIITRFAPFTSREVNSNLRSVLLWVCSNSEENVQQIFPLEYLSGFFKMFKQRLDSYPPNSERGFSAAVEELCYFVSKYNADYVQEPLRRIRRGQWLAQFQGAHREDVERRIEAARESWAAFLHDFQNLMQKLNHDFKDNRFQANYETPERL